MSPSSTSRLLAVVSDIIAALSHASLVIGCAISCSQALFANRPSWVLGSRTNAISVPALEPASNGVKVCASTPASTASPASTPAPVSGTMPSASQRSQVPSNAVSTAGLTGPATILLSLPWPWPWPWPCPGGDVWLRQYRRRSSCVPTSPSPTNAASTSASATPPQSGAMSGCTSDTVPSVARTSPHDSRGCAAGTRVRHAAAVSSSYNV